MSNPNRPILYVGLSPLASRRQLEDPPPDRIDRALGYADAVIAVVAILAFVVLIALSCAGWLS